MAEGGNARPGFTLESPAGPVRGGQQLAEQGFWVNSV